MFKKFFAIIVVYVIYGLLCHSAHSFTAKSILLLGDSLSASYGMKQNEGWVHLFNQATQDNDIGIKIENASISGETTGGGLARLPTILAKQSYDYLLIELGGNDGLRGFPPKLIKNNLLQIIELAKQHGVEVMLMEIRIPPNYGPRYNQQFNAIYTDLAETQQITLLPFFIEDIAQDPELMQADGIHPTREAQATIANTMMVTLKQKLLSD